MKLELNEKWYDLTVLIILKIPSCRQMIPRLINTFTTRHNECEKKREKQIIIQIAVYRVINRPRCPGIALFEEMSWNWRDPLLCSITTDITGKQEIGYTRPTNFNEYKVVLWLGSLRCYKE